MSPHSAERAVWAPRTIAVVGASDDPDKIGGRPVRYLKAYGFTGSVWPVNKGRSKVQGLPAFPALDALPGVPDAVVVAVPRPQALPVVEASARLGARLAVVMTSGFAETGDPASINDERAMTAAAGASGMRVVGPNSQGLADFATGTVLSFSTMFLEQPPLDGPVGIVSQSGALTGAVYGLVRGLGIGVRYAHATGNDADVTAAELAGVVAADEELRVLLLYLENLKDVAGFSAAFQVAQERDLPAVALVGGRTAIGQQAAHSHTGALASEARGVEAFLRRHGVRQVTSLRELVAAVPLYVRRARSRGRGLAIVSNSGAIGVLGADAAGDHGMPLARFSPPVTAALKQVVPEYGSVANPVDITAGLLGRPEMLGNVLGVLRGAADVDGVAVGLPVSGTGYDMDRIVGDVRDCVHRDGPAIALATPQPDVAARFRAAGVATYEDIGDAIATLAGYGAHAELRRRARGWLAWRAPVEASQSESLAASQALNEAASLALLVEAQLPVISHRLCRTVDDAVEFFERAGQRIVLKGCTSAVTHKSDLGLVRLGLNSGAEVADAFRLLTATSVAQGVELDGILAAVQVSSRRELLLGARIDPLFGPVVVVGAGGTDAELLRDVAVLLAPLDADEVIAVLHGLRISRLFGGGRGLPAWDIRSFADAAVRLGALVAERAASAHRIVSVDVNPVILDEAGRGCWAVDAVVAGSTADWPAALTRPDND